MVPLGRGPGWRTRRRSEQPISHQAPLVWRVPEGLAAVPVGGGGAWPDNESTRRAFRLAARTVSGRAAAHGHIKQPGPAGQTEQPGPAGQTEQPGRAYEAKPQELGGVTTHGSVDKERNPEIPSASITCEIASVGGHTA